MDKKIVVIGSGVGAVRSAKVQHLMTKLSATTIGPAMALSGLSHCFSVSTLRVIDFDRTARKYLSDLDTGKRGYKKPTALSRLQQRNNALKSR